MAAAPAVGAPVGQRRKRLVDEVTVGAVDLNAVEAGLGRAAGCLHVGVDDRLGLAVVKGPRFGHVVAGRRREERPAAQRGRDLGAAKVDLRHHAGIARLVHGPGYAGEPGNLVVGVDAGHADRAFAVAPHVGVAHDDEGDAAAREPAVQLHLRVRDAAVVVGHEVVGGRAHDPVGEQQRADPYLRKEVCHGAGV